MAKRPTLAAPLFATLFAPGLGEPGNKQQSKEYLDPAPLHASVKRRPGASLRNLAAESFTKAKILCNQNNSWGCAAFGV